MKGYNQKTEEENSKTFVSSFFNKKSKVKKTCINTQFLPQKEETNTKKVDKILFLHDQERKGRKKGVVRTQNPRN